MNKNDETRYVKRPKVLTKEQLAIAKENGIPVKVAQERYRKHRWSADAAIHTKYVPGATFTPLPERITEPRIFAAVITGENWELLYSTEGYYKQKKKVDPDCRIIPVRSIKHLKRALTEHFGYDVRIPTNAYSTGLPMISSDEYLAKEEEKAATVNYAVVIMGDFWELTRSTDANYKQKTEDNPGSKIIPVHSVVHLMGLLKEHFGYDIHIPMHVDAALPYATLEDHFDAESLQYVKDTKEETDNEN